MNSLSSAIYPQAGKRKFIFFSGKGGVGKTSMACIAAVKTAQEGFKTLLLTTDPAAHIGNVLDRPVTDKISSIEGIDNLYAVKIDQKKATEEYKAQVLKEAKGRFDPNTLMVMKEELESPCTEEMAAFQKFVEFASNEEYEVIVIDTAPTGHTLRLLELPMDWSKQIQIKAGIYSELSEADRLQKKRFDKVMENMKDEALTSFAFVMYPEKTPIAEAKRASEELIALDIKTQLVVANLIIPEEQAITSFYKNRRSMQLGYIEEIKETFKDSVLLQVPMQEEEIKGLAMLTAIGQEILPSH